MDNKEIDNFSKRILLNSLYDIYSKLLTEKQKMYFEDYYFSNLSYGEMSEKYNVTRNALFHQMKLIEEKLTTFEEKLKLLEKKNKINDIIESENNKRIKEMLEDLF